MSQRYVTTHKGWEIQATARKVAEGHHEPAVSIVRNDDDASFEYVLSIPEFLAFDSASAAANYGLRHAMQYIDANDA